MIRLTTYGTIQGGMCEKEHQNRSDREGGANWAFDECVKRGFVVFEGKSIFIKGAPSLTFKTITNKSRQYGSGSCAFEIGFYRGNSVLESKSGRWLTLKYVRACLMKSCAQVMDLSGNVQQNGIYQLKKKSPKNDRP